MCCLLFACCCLLFAYCCLLLLLLKPSTRFLPSKLLAGAKQVFKWLSLPCVCLINLVGDAVANHVWGHPATSAITMTTTMTITTTMTTMTRTMTMTMTITTKITTTTTISVVGVLTCSWLMNRSDLHW